MGRPIKKKFFGNLNNQQFGNVGSNSGIGGEGFATLTASATLGSLVINSSYAQPTLVIPAPAIPTGTQATATVTWEVESVTVTNGLAGHGYSLTTNGGTLLTGLGGGATFNITAVGSGQGEVQTIVPFNRGSFTTVPTAAVTYQIQGGDGNNQSQVKFRIKSIVLTNAGSGYDAVPTLTWDDGGSHSGTMPGNPTVTLTSTTQNALEGVAYLLAKDGGASAKTYDIVKQEASHRYLVKTADGIGQCKLVASNSPTAGQMNLIATDQYGSTYWVTKLTARRVIITQRSMSGQYEFDSNSRAGWTLGSANTGVVTLKSA